MRLSWFQRDAFELAYLAQLTRAGLKPVSRWEKRFDAPTVDRLQACGLQTRMVQRALRNGSPAPELLFSTHPQPLDEYAARFDGRPVGVTAEGRRLEGQLFGYPPCATHSALPESRLSPAIVAAATALTVLVLPPGSLAGPDPTDDPHQLPLAEWDDADRDFLTAFEEAELGCDPANPDQNGNQVPDGVDLAREAAGRIGQLPTAADPQRVYRRDFMLRGVERCDVCGIWVNRGHLTVCNPVADLYCKLPYVALHYLQHGALAVSAEERIDPVALQALLRPAVEVRLSGSRPELRWFGTFGRRYQVLKATDPVGPWEPGPIFVGQGNELIVVDPTAQAGERRFYRLQAW